MEAKPQLYHILSVCISFVPSSYQVKGDLFGALKDETGDIAFALIWLWLMSEIMGFVLKKYTRLKLKSFKDCKIRIVCSVRVMWYQDVYYDQSTVHYVEGQKKKTTGVYWFWIVK